MNNYVTFALGLHALLWSNGHAGTMVIGTDALVVQDGGLSTLPVWKLKESAWPQNLAERQIKIVETDLISDIKVKYVSEA